MSAVEIITLFITILCLVSFCAVFTILFHHYYASNIEAVSSGKEDIALIDNAIDEEILAIVLKISMAVSFVFFAAAMFFPRSLMRIFTDDQELIYGNHLIQLFQALDFFVFSRYGSGTV